MAACAVVAALGARAIVLGANEVRNEAAPGQAETITAVAFSPDGTRLVTAGIDKAVRLREGATSKEVLSLNGHRGRVVALAFSRDGRHLATAGWESSSRIWEVATGKLVQTVTGHEAAVLGVAFSADGARLATASSDRTVKVWDWASGENTVTITGHGGPVTAVAFNGDGSRIATASWDKTAKLWDARTGKELLTLTGHEDRLTGVIFTPDGAGILTTSWDGSAVLWEAESGRQVRSFTGHTRGAWALALDRDGKQFATASGDGAVRLWEVASGKLVRRWTAHPGPIQGIWIDSEGKRLGTVGQEGVAKVWEMDSGRELLALGIPKVVETHRPSTKASAALPPGSPDAAQAATGAAAKGSGGNGLAKVTPGYRIGAGDVLQINVWKEPEASTPQVTVRTDGKISLPIIHEVEVVGLTPTELEKLLAEKLSQFINQAEVTVVTKEIHSQKVYLIGGVKKEGAIRLLTSMTVMQALAEAGGVTDYAKKKNIYVLRTVDQKRVRLPFDYTAALRGENMEQNVTLLPGDMIVVPQ